MGATPKITTRKRLSSVDNARRYNDLESSQYKSNRKLIYDSNPRPDLSPPPPPPPPPPVHPSTQGIGSAYRQRRRRSTGYYPPSPSPTKVQFRSDEEEGDHSCSDDNHSGNGDRRDSSQSSSSQSPPRDVSTRSDTYFVDLNIPLNDVASTTSTATTARKTNYRSDSDLGSRSIQGGLPTSVLKGIRNRNQRHEGNVVKGTTGILRKGNQRTRSEADASDTVLAPELLVLRDDLSTLSGRIPVDVSPGGGDAGSVRSSRGTSPSGGSSSRQRVLATKLWRILRTKNPFVLLLVTGVSMLGVGLYTQSYATLSTTLEQVISNTNERRKTVAGHFDSVERDIYSLQRQLLELDPEATALLSSVAAEERELAGDPDDGKATATETTDLQESGLFDEMVAVKEKMRIESSRISAFERYIQDTSLRDATRKYGTGILRVQLDLEFPADRLAAQAAAAAAAQDHAKSKAKSNSSNNNDDALRKAKSDPGAISASTPSAHVLVLEMAPLELMPHSVYTFLEMVDAKLFDGCSFILNAMNNIKAAPLPYDGSSASAKVKAFHKKGLDTVSFKEYSADFPHEQYTVGFAAEEIGAFYINTDDNTEQHADEPCFARIVSGFETVERMEAEPTRMGMFFKKRIGIKKAVIL